MNHVRGRAAGAGLSFLGMIAVAWSGAGCEQPASSAAGAPDAQATPDATTVDATTDGTVKGTDGAGGSDAFVDVDVDADAGGDDADAATVPDAAADTSAPDTGTGLPVDPDAAAPGTFCALPGSIVWTAGGPVRLSADAASSPDLSWLELPPGFCAHYFATVKTVRQIRFAPDGLVFAASPTMTTTGGANNGIGGIVVLPDDDHDGVADTNLTFLSKLPAVQGLMFTNGYFYYQDGSIIRRVAYAPGDRAPSASSEVVTDMTTSGLPQDGLHWPKVFDVAQDGTIYITNGGSQSDACLSTWPPRGAVTRLQPDGTTTVVAMGFRNPIAMRCEQDHDLCLVVELALDYSGDTGGREKLVPLRQNDNWGFPCCATQGLPHAGVRYSDTNMTPDCSGVASESDAFIIGHTPFGVDFAPAGWPAPWGGRVFVTLHGVVGSWVGARVVGIAMDPATGLPLPASEIDASVGAAGNMMDFATGWDDGRQDHGRPAPIAFAPDGRMFLGDDQRGAVVWIAPVDLPATP